MIIGRAVARRRHILTVVVLVLMLVITPVSTSALATGETVRVSIGNSDIQGDGHSGATSISADGRYVAFQSHAANLVPGDSNGGLDVFVRDLNDGTTICASVNLDGELAGAHWESGPSISADGRYVAFCSFASDLVLGDTNDDIDIFVRDLVLGTTACASVDVAGVPSGGWCLSPSISADGRYVAFQSAAPLVVGDTNSDNDVFVRDMTTGTTALASVSSTGVQGLNHSGSPSISADGRHVAFSSDANNLVPGDTNGHVDVFVRDLDAQATERVSVSSAGAEGDGWSPYTPSISADGRYVAFQSNATNLVAGDTNGSQDIFVRDVLDDTTARISVDSAGAQSNGASRDPSISSDGCYVVFASGATSLVAGDTNAADDCFVRDLVAETTSRVSVSSEGAQADGLSSQERPTISGDGLYVAFDSWATNLVSGDTNGFSDVFVHYSGPAAPLAGTFVIDGGATYSATGLLTFASAVPDALEMRIRASEDGITWGSWGDWAAYDPTVGMGVSEDGEWHYEVEYRAGARTLTLQDSIIVDSTAPSTPSALAAAAASSSAVDLSWSGATDATSGMAGYVVYKGGVQVAEVTGTTYQATGLSASTSYSFTVRAKDNGGNTSADSNTASATTLAASVTPVPVYRFYRASTGTHFYTADAAEMARVRDTMASTYSLDGIGYYINTSNPANSVPLYRFYNVRTGTHLYTADESEKNSIIANLSDTYSLDGVSYYVSMSSGTQVHRFYSPSKGVHFYSSDPTEIANVQANLGHIWSYEGPAYLVGQ